MKKTNHVIQITYPSPVAPSIFDFRLTAVWMPPDRPVVSKLFITTSSPLGESLVSLMLAKIPPHPPTHTTHLTVSVSRLNDHGEICRDTDPVVSCL